jgi:hypothetical protein
MTEKLDPDPDFHTGQIFIVVEHNTGFPLVAWNNCTAGVWSDSLEENERGWEVSRISKKS